jgi:ribosomal protein RSM22 (predicted rRNA methylase)
VRVPHELEDAVREAARSVLGESPLATAALTRAIVDRSQRYTSDRDRLASPRDADADLAARAAFFTIADAMKIAVPVNELIARGALPKARPLRVVDLGAGCGAMSLGLIATLDALPLAALDPVPLAITAIDHDARALAIAAKAMRGLAAGRSFVTKTGDVGRAEIPPADLVVMGSVLNELFAEGALSLVERALQAIGEDGAVIVIEPALRETSRALHAIRDAVIARGRGHVFAPCTRRCVPCTALADPSDWCHEDRAVELPPQTAALARVTHLRDSGMKFSYLVLRRKPHDLVEAGPNAWRVVSAPMVAKGKLELIGCSERGRVRLRLLKRNRNAANREIEAADRGDIVVIDREIEGERVEIGGDTRVERIDMLEE